MIRVANELKKLAVGGMMVDYAQYLFDDGKFGAPLVVAIGIFLLGSSFVAMATLAFHAIKEAIHA